MNNLTRKQLELLLGKDCVNAGWQAIKAEIDRHNDRLEDCNMTYYVRTTPAYPHGFDINVHDTGLPDCFKRYLKAFGEPVNENSPNNRVPQSNAFVDHIGRLLARKTTK